MCIFAIFEQKSVDKFQTMTENDTHRCTFFKNDKNGAKTCQFERIFAIFEQKSVDKYQTMTENDTHRCAFFQKKYKGPDLWSFLKKVQRSGPLVVFKKSTQVRTFGHF